MSDVRGRGRTKATPAAAAPQDVRLVGEAIVRRAVEDVELACRLLKLAGAIPPEKTRRKRPTPVTMELMLKSAVLMRLLRWDQVPAAERHLPDPQALLEDMTKPPDWQKFDANQLAREVLETWLRTMSWSPLKDAGADVVIEDVQPQPVADELAQLLWQFRHLVDPTGKGGQPR